MSPEIHQRVRQLFAEALELTEAERLPFLQTACAGNSEVFGKVAQLLAAHVEAGHFLEGEPARPQRIGRYVVTAELGRGSMGIVYKAIDPLIGREVAVKVIRLQLLADGKEAAFLREQLFREARSAGGLFHPGIVVILDVGQEGDVPFIAMEYVDGPSLSQVLAARPRIDSDESLQFLQQTAAALDFAHAKGVVHRDIKPANIMLAKGVTVKVADFGIAKITSSQRYTKTGATMGTPKYMSPEQVDAKPLDGRSDQFSLAVVSFEMLTGVQPFEAESFTALAHTIAYGPRPSACAANPQLPAGVDQVFYRGLGKLPGERYASCREFVAALEGALTARVPGAQNVPRDTVPPLQVTREVRNRRMRPSRYIVGGATAAMLFVGAWVGKVGNKRLANPPAASQKNPPAADQQAAAPSDVPVIERFSADSESVQPGGLAELNWEVHGVADVNIVPDLGKKPAVGRARVQPAAPTYYHLTATNAAGTVFKEVYIAVNSLLSLYLDGERKLHRRQFDQGLAALRDAGELGELHAMLALADIYGQDGEGHRRNDKEAFYWFSKAAIAGSADGMLNLAICYYTGAGVDADDQLAAKWFTNAAELGNSDAILNLGDMYEHGKGYDKNLGKARDFYRRAAMMGNKEAKKRLAELDGRSQGRRQTN